VDGDLSVFKDITGNPPALGTFGGGLDRLVADGKTMAPELALAF
jgi:hypothetical protein